MGVASNEPGPSSYLAAYEERSSWDGSSLSLAASKTVSMDGSTLRYDASSKRASTISLVTVKSAPSMRTTRSRPAHTRRGSGIMGILLRSFTLVTMLPRISSARSELAVIQRNSVPAPLYRQTKLLDDFFDLTGSALKLIQFSFGHLVHDIFTASVRQQFISALKELCSEELPFSVRREGLTNFNYLVGAGASLRSKNFALEHEDCRAILNMLKATTLVSLKLAACAYLWLSCKTLGERVHSPISETELSDICLTLVDLTQHPLPIDTRKNALDWLWRFENAHNTGLSTGERHEVWTSILEICGYTESNGLLLYHHADSENDYLSGLWRLWWFSILSSWTMDIQYGKKKLHKIGADLLSITDPTHSHEIRKQGFELIALFSNLPHWKGMFDEGAWRTISNEFADFCLRDTERVNKDDIMRRVESLLVRSTSIDSDSSTSNKWKELQVSRRLSIRSTHHYNQVTAANKAIREHCGPDTSVEAALDNLAVFTLPGEYLLIQKDQQAILYERICNYTRLDQTRRIAVQAMYALLTIQEWLSGISYATGPPKGSD